MTRSKHTLAVIEALQTGPATCAELAEVLSLSAARVCGILTFLQVGGLTLPQVRYDAGKWRFRAAGDTPAGPLHDGTPAVLYVDDDRPTGTVKFSDFD